MPASGIRGNSGDTLRDDNGVIRYQTGLLPANGVSPAHWGVRVNDATGAPILDTLGLITGLTQIAKATIAPTPVTTANNLTYSTVPNSPMTITLARALGVLVFYGGAGFVSGSATFCYAYAFLDGTRVDNTFGLGLGSRMLFDKTTVGNVNGFIFAWLPSLTAGLHTIDLRAATDAGATLNLSTTDGVAFLLGG
jgi:hypothetical protein